MNSTKELLHQINDPTISADQQARLRCELARQLEQSWNFEAAREAMGHLWRRVGERPGLEGINEYSQAEVLLRAGALTGWIGSTRQIEGAQETAKDLITESITVFKSAGATAKVSEAQIELAFCIWRQGRFDDARVLLQEALARPNDLDGAIRALGFLRSGMVEASDNRFHDALRIYEEAAGLFESLGNNALKGKFHNQFGFVLRNLSESDQRKEYLDRALIEYAAASFYFDQAKLSRHQACVENNLGFLFGTIGNFSEAHEHLDRAQAIFTTLRDSVHLAQVDDARARILLAQGRLEQAAKVVRAAVEALKDGGEQSLLAEALTTQGTIQARMQNYQHAQSTLERAIEIAEQSGDPSGGGRICLTLIEELTHRLSNDELFLTVDRARRLLESTKDVATLRRLAHCACEALCLIAAQPVHPDWAKFSWKDVMQRYEAHFIELALQDAGGSVTQAAYLLGFKHHQSLSALLQKRHQNLLAARSAIVPRKRRLIGEQDAAQPATRTIRMLYVEDDEMVAGMIKEMLELQGWQIDRHADGQQALDRILSDAHYDLLLLDHDLPGTNGIELVRRARRLAHRSTTPIIVLSATPIEAAALKAGADQFLQKPQAVSSLVETVSAFLEEREPEDYKPS
jgi:CheY-like chemotaxis protein/tetratricopeptide (TPR) repeat protein